MMSVDSEIGYATDQSVSFEIVEGVAAVKDVPSLELAPLYTVIDPDALEKLCSGPFQQGHVTFRYEGCTVQIHDGDQISITETTDE